MKIRSSADELSEGIADAFTVVPKKATNDVLKHILLEAVDGKLIVTGSDLTVSVRQVVDDIEIIEEGALLLEAAGLKRILAGLGSEQIGLKDAGKGHGQIIGTQGKWKLAGAVVENYPNLSEWDDAQPQFSLSAEALVELFKKTMFAADRNFGRFAMNGVRLEVHDDRIRTVATDNKRFALCERYGEFVPQDAVILPVLGVEALLRVFREGDVDVQIDSSYVRVKDGRTETMIRLVDGNYPPYEDHIPDEKDIKIPFAKSALSSLLRQAMLTTSKDIAAGKFRFADNELEVSIQGDAEQQGRVSMEIDYDDEELIFGFNPKHFQDGLNALDNADLVLEIDDPSQFAMIQENTEDTAFVYLIVPRNLAR